MTNPNLPGIIHDAIAAAGLPVLTVRVSDAGAVVVMQAGASQAQQDQAQAIADGTFASETALTDTQLLRRAAKKIVTSSAAADGKLARALASVLVDELNVQRQWSMGLKAAVAAASNFADLKARIAALPNLPDRTLA